MTSTPPEEAVRARGGACAVTAGRRAAQGVLAALAGTVAYVAATSGRPWCAVPAGVCGVFLAVGAVTGWCPTSLLRRNQRSAMSPIHGYPDARGLVDLAPGRHGSPR
jgi:hypothetical protein